MFCVALGRVVVFIASDAFWVFEVELVLFALPRTPHPMVRSESTKTKPVIKAVLVETAARIPVKVIPRR